MMRMILLAASLTLACMALSTPAGSGTGKDTTLTGVIVQKGTDFEIAETENMKPIASLEGVEFATDNLANFVGQTVRARGTLVTTAEGRKVLRVRTMADIVRVQPPASATQP